MDASTHCVCDRCGATFKAAEVARNHWGDQVCPRCRSADIRPQVGRWAWVRAFLIEYNKH